MLRRRSVRGELLSSVGAWRHAIAAALAAAAVTWAWPAAIQAATINVTTTSDDAVAGDGTVSPMRRPTHL
jgi:hypothetical protein